MMVNTTELKATISGVEYTWNGGIGSVMTSVESRLKLGELRVVGDQTIYVWNIEKPLFKKPIVHWSFIGIDVESLRAFKAAMFGYYML